MTVTGTHCQGRVAHPPKSCTLRVADVADPKKAELSPRTVNKIARMGGMKHGSALDLQEKMDKKNEAAYFKKLCAPVLQRPSLCHFTTHPAGCAL